MVYAIVVPLDLGLQKSISEVYGLLGRLLELNNVKVFFSREPFTVKTLVDEYYYIYITFGVNTMIIPLTDSEIEEEVAKFKVKYFKVYEPFRVKGFSIRKERIAINPEIQHIIPQEITPLCTRETGEKHTIGPSWSSKIVVFSNGNVELPRTIVRENTKLEHPLLKSIMPWHPICYGIKELGLKRDVNEISVFKIREEDYLCDPLYYVPTAEEYYAIIVYGDEKVVFSDSKLLNVEEKEKNKLLLLLLNCIIYTWSSKVNVRVV